MIKTRASEQGLCCQSCQEEVNVHGCKSCHRTFEDGDVILCKHHSHLDCEHYHDQCKPKE